MSRRASIPARRVRKLYRNFIEHEVQGLSALYTEMTEAVCTDERLLEFVSALPRPKRQPNLVFAAVRHLFGNPRDGRKFARIVMDHADPIRRLIRARSTQTNEPGRCAVILPILARLPQPLALIEAGASAGLCLLPDCYAYDYGGTNIGPGVAIRAAPPVFPCAVNAATPIPDRLPQIVWRRGLDLSPIDVSDRQQTSWLETLVWPEHSARLARLRAALEIARESPPLVIRGDIRKDLAALAASAPKGASDFGYRSRRIGPISRRYRPGPNPPGHARRPLRVRDFGGRGR